MIYFILCKQNLGTRCNDGNKEIFTHRFFMDDKAASKKNPQSARMKPEDWEFEGCSEPHEFGGFVAQISLILKKLEGFLNGK